MLQLGLILKKMIFCKNLYFIFRLGLIFCSIRIYVYPVEAKKFFIIFFFFEIIFFHFILINWKIYLLCYVSFNLRMRGKAKIILVNMSSSKDEYLFFFTNSFSYLLLILFNGVFFFCFEYNCDYLNWSLKYILMKFLWENWQHCKIELMSNWQLMLKIQDGG